MKKTFGNDIATVIIILGILVVGLWFHQIDLLLAFVAGLSVGLYLK